MPLVVPSDVIRAIDRMLDTFLRPGAFPQVGHDQVPRLVAVARLVQAVPPSLVTLAPAAYAELVASVAYIEALPAVCQAGRQPIPLNLHGYDLNPIALIHRAMAACPDQAPAAVTSELAFITDVELRESVRLDISLATQDLSQGEWKGATVLAGSAIEALLLWALEGDERRNPGTRAAAVTALLASGALTRQPNANIERWDLHEYGEAAAGRQLITAETATLVRLARNFRNLIHPGRAQRLGQSCDRPTALAALAAAEAVARDLTHLRWRRDVRSDGGGSAACRGAGS